MSEPQLNLPIHLFAKAFPFHLVFDRDRQIVQTGEVLQRVSPKPLIGSSLEQHFRIRRPNIPVDFEAIHKQSRSLFLLESLDNEMQLKGQMMYAEEQEVMFFLCSLWVTDTATLSPLGVKLKDFAIHDPIVDFLFLLQAKNTALADAKQLTDELTQQRAELREALQVQAELADTAQAQAQELSFALQQLQETQAQLIQTEKMSSLGQLIAGIAHEINNPVNFIYGNLTYANQYTENLLKLVSLYQQSYPDAAEEIRSYAESIELDFLIEDLPNMLTSMKVGADRIRQIVLSLRNFSRIDEAEKKPVNLHEGINNTLMILQHRLKTRVGHPEISVIKEYGDLPLIDCYAGQLNQVFMNIIGNAIDALEERKAKESKARKNNSKPFSPFIKIRTEITDDDRVIIRIVDNGLGMPERVKQQLFNPFFTTKPIGKGTGLGLSICYEIVVGKHGGSIRCLSEPGQGSEFWIEIPIKPNQPPTSKSISAATT